MDRLSKDLFSANNWRDLFDKPARRPAEPAVAAPDPRSRRKRRKSDLRRRTAMPLAPVQELESRQLMTLGIGTPALNLFSLQNATPLTGAVTPQQLREAYGFYNIGFLNPASIEGFGSDQYDYYNAHAGAGQTIAIIDAFGSPNIQNDLNTFDQQYGLPNTSLKIVNQNGSSTITTTRNDAWAAETSGDVEVVHALAPAANILLIERDDNSFASAEAAVNYARQQPGVSVVSMSYGSVEANDFTSLQQEQATDADYTTPAGHIGVTFVASSGDDGITVEYPSASPNVLTTGATTLTTDSGGDYKSEAAASGGSLSTGGFSKFEPLPTYQDNANTGSTKRGVPDVSFNGINDSFFVSDTLVGNSSVAPGWGRFSGTSAAAPAWAALIAIVDSRRGQIGEGTLTSTDTLNRLYSLPATDFHDITSGSNVNFSTTPGWDPVTGLGSPKADQVVPALTYDDLSSIKVVGTTLNATQDLPFTATVATLAGENPNHFSNEFTATVAWDDNYSVQTPAQVALVGNSFQVTASYEFLTPGTHFGLVYVQAQGDVIERGIVEVQVAPSTSLSLINRVLTVQGKALNLGSENLALSVVSSQLLVNLNGVNVGLVPTSDLSSVVVTTGSGTNTVDIEQSTAGVPITVNLGTGTNAVTISSNRHNLNAIAASVTVNGGTGVNSLTIDDQADTGNTTYYAAGSTVQASGLALIGFTGKVALVLNGGTGADTYDLGVTATGALPALTPASGSSLTLNTGGTAADQIDLTDRDAVDASGSAGSSLFALPNLTIYGHSADTLTIDESGLNDAGVTRGPQSITIAPGAVTVGTGGTKNSGVPSAFLGLTNINESGAGVVEAIGDSRGTTFRIGNGITSLNLLPSRVIVVGGGTDPLTIDDTPTAATGSLPNIFTQFTVTGQSVGRQDTALMEVGATSFPIGYYTEIDDRGIGSLTLMSGKSGNVFQVQGTAKGVATTIDAGPSSNSVVVGSSTNSLAGLLGPLTINGNGGNNSLTVDGQGDSGVGYTLTAGSIVPSKSSTAINFMRDRRCGPERGVRQCDHEPHDGRRRSGRRDVAHTQRRCQHHTWRGRYARA